MNARFCLNKQKLFCAGFQIFNYISKKYLWVWNILIIPLVHRVLSVVIHHHSLKNVYLFDRQTGNKQMHSIKLQWYLYKISRETSSYFNYHDYYFIFINLALTFDMYTYIHKLKKKSSKFENSLNYIFTHTPIDTFCL
jgi:hypothetical protein